VALLCAELEAARAAAARCVSGRTVSGSPARPQRRLRCCGLRRRVRAASHGELSLIRRRSGPRSRRWLAGAARPYTRRCVVPGAAVVG
jgi:hypothetical protein